MGLAPKQRDQAGNLLMMTPRARHNSEWIKRSPELIDTGFAAWKAAEARNVNTLFTVGGDIYEACSHCHQQYLDAIKNANIRARLPRRTLAHLKGAENEPTEDGQHT